MRDSNAVSRSLVVSFFIQRHPQAKSTTNERKDGLIEGRKSTKRWDFEELTEAIFQCNFTIVCRQCQTHRKTKVSGKLPEQFDPVNSTPDKHGIHYLDIFVTQGLKC